MATNRAGEGLLLAVVELMIPEGSGLAIRFATNVTFEPLRIVTGHVPNVGHLRLKIFATALAQEVG